jgi:hypothetical protein
MIDKVVAQSNAFSMMGKKITRQSAQNRKLARVRLFRRFFDKLDEIKKKPN